MKPPLPHRYHNPLVTPRPMVGYGPIPRHGRLLLLPRPFPRERPRGRPRGPDQGGGSPALGGGPADQRPRRPGGGPPRDQGGGSPEPGAGGEEGAGGGG